MSLEPNHILILGMAILGLALVMRATRKRTVASRRESGPSARERYTELQHSAGAARDLEQVMTELDQLARQIHGRIDTKVATLEAVIRDADRRIDDLSRLMRTANGAATLDVTIDDAARSDAAAKESRAANVRERLSPTEGSAVSARNSDPRKTLGSTPQANSEPSLVHQNIFQLADAGRTAAEIAERTGRPAGEVELILSLRKARDRVPTSRTDAVRP